MVVKVMTATSVVGEAVYQSYKYNRERKPEITPEEWKRIFANVDEMERRFQIEQEWESSVCHDCNHASITEKGISCNIGVIAAKYGQRCRFYC